LALADFAAAEVKVALLAALRDPEDMVRRAALWSLARQGHPEWEQLLDINLRGREVEFPSLDDAAARETLIWLVQQDRLPFDRKGPLLMFLSRNAKPELLDLLLAALHSGELRIETATGIPQARMAAIKVVGATRSPKVVDVLLRHLRHDDAAVRREAVEALGKLPAPLNIQGLATSLGCQDQDVRALAGEKLAALGLPHFRDAALVEPNYLNELAMLRDERTTEAVIWALSSGDKDVRAAAVHALPLRCQAKALQAGLRMLNDKEPSVQCAAVEAIEDFAQHPGRPEGYGAIVEALSADDSSSPLAALCRWDAELRMRLAVAVAVLGQPQWRDLIRGNTEDFGRLARTGSACFVGPLLEGLTQWPHAGRVAAAKALAIMHRLRPELLGDRWQKVRELAAQPHVDKILDEWDRRQDYDGYWHSDGHLSYGIGVEL
jgi:HEAT repeat protein